MFQIINLLFLSRNWATFASKVAQFFIENKWFFTDNPMCYYIELNNFGIGS